MMKNGIGLECIIFQELVDMWRYLNVDYWVLAKSKNALKKVLFWQYKGVLCIKKFFNEFYANCCKLKFNGCCKIYQKNRKFKTILFSYYYVILHNIYKVFIKKMQEP